MAFRNIVFSVFLLIAAASAAVPQGRRDHNFVDCNHNDPTWTLLLHKSVSTKGNWWQVKSELLRFPVTGMAEEVIECITVTDKVSNGRGGYVELVEGGKGFNYAILKFESQIGRGYDFDVQILGRI